MQRYSLTRSGVCDCMYKDNNGPWVMFKEADQALHQARREGCEQCQREAEEIANKHRVPFTADAIAAMEYKEKSND